jgi:spore coat polysaccharide biosynthesis predicted glycosyltransferase SpsG
LKIPPNENIKKALCGLEYHLIKKEILNLHKATLEEDPKKALLTMGGSDNKELTVALMGHVVFCRKKL